MTALTTIENIIAGHFDDALFSVETPSPTTRGKVRDMFDRGDTLYMVNTDRVSAFDQVLGTIPLKGALLCEQAAYWFRYTKDICPNHFVDQPDPQIMVCKRARPFAIEMIVRGYLAGSLMRDDPTTRGRAYGLTLDPHHKPYAPFAEPIITPTTKAAVGEHDMPISPDAIIASNLLTKKQWEEIASYALQLFNACAAHAREHGLLLIDTKYEFGLIDDTIHLIDEVHTSDSSRFFIESDYHEKFLCNETPIMLDKEFLRQHLMARGVKPSDTNLSELVLDNDLRLEVAKRYFQLTEKIIGRDFVAPTIGATPRVHQRLRELIC